MRTRVLLVCTQLLTNILVLSAGGNGHVPIPLLKQPEELFATPSTPRLLFVHNGAIDIMVRPLRYALRYELLTSSSALSAEQKLLVSYATPTYANGTNWRSLLPDAAFVLTPRGGGRSAFIVYEVIQMGFLPVYVWDDFEWLPYQGTAADLTRFGFSVRLGTFRTRILEVMAAFQPAEIARRRALVRSLRSSHFTYEGVLDQISRLLSYGTTGPVGSDLRCLRRAPLGGPLCLPWNRANMYHYGFTPCAPSWYPDWERTKNATERRYPWHDRLRILWNRTVVKSRSITLSEADIAAILGLDEMLADGSA